LYASPDIIRETMSKKMRWAGHVARMGREMHTRFWSVNLKGRNYSEDLGVDAKIVLE